MTHRALDTRVRERVAWRHPRSQGLSLSPLKSDVSIISKLQYLPWNPRTPEHEPLKIDLTNLEQALWLRVTQQANTLYGNKQWQEHLTKTGILINVFLKSPK